MKHRTKKTTAIVHVDNSDLSPEEIEQLEAERLEALDAEDAEKVLPAADQPLTLQDCVIGADDISFSIVKHRGQYVLATFYATGDVKLSTPDTLEGTLKRLTEKARYFAKIIDHSKESFVPYVKMQLTPDDQRSFDRLKRAAHKAGEEAWDDATLLTPEQASAITNKAENAQSL